MYINHRLLWAYGHNELLNIQASKYSKLLVSIVSN